VIQTPIDYVSRIIRVLLLAVIVIASVTTSQRAQAGPAARVIARGGGKTIVQGGTGQPAFSPVITTIAFHAEQRSQVISGGFECLAIVPAVQTGNGSGQFTVNAMYVTGQITSVQIEGDMATLRGAAIITGLGAGTNVPFTFVVRSGGPGSTAVLTTEGSPRLVFNEILLEGSFEVSGNESNL
jgi:hypothetical protein